MFGLYLVGVRNQLVTFCVYVLTFYGHAPSDCSCPSESHCHQTLKKHLCYSNLKIKQINGARICCQQLVVRFRTQLVFALMNTKGIQHGVYTNENNRSEKYSIPYREDLFDKYSARTQCFFFCGFAFFCSFFLISSLFFEEICFFFSVFFSGNFAFFS